METNARRAVDGAHAAHEGVNFKTCARPIDARPTVMACIATLAVAIPILVVVGVAVVVVVAAVVVVVALIDIYRWRRRWARLVAMVSHDWSRVIAVITHHRT